MASTGSGRGTRRSRAVQGKGGATGDVPPREGRGVRRADGEGDRPVDRIDPAGPAPDASADPVDGSPRHVPGPSMARAAVARYLPSRSGRARADATPRAERDNVQVPSDDTTGGSSRGIGSWGDVIARAFPDDRTPDCGMLPEQVPFPRVVVYVRHRSDRSGPNIYARVGTALAAAAAIGVIPRTCRVLVDELDRRRTIEELQALVRSGDVEVVVVDRIGSLSGDVIVLDALMREFAAAGVELVVPGLGRLARADLPAAGLLPSARRLRG